MGQETLINNEAQAVADNETVAAANAVVGLANATAALAEVEAAQTVAEVREDIAELNNQIDNQEGGLVWLRNQVQELREMTMRQADELSTLRISLEEARQESEIARAAAVAAGQIAIEASQETDLSNLSETAMETSSETPMEHPENVEAESPEAEPAPLEKSAKKRNRILV